jgi:hypothetical protein
MLLGLTMENLKPKESAMRFIQASDRQQIDPSNLYRMPWTSSDNAFSWLEITRRCNLQFGYCYQKNRPGSDKDMSQRI